MLSNTARFEREAIPFLSLPYQPYMTLNEVIAWVGRHHVEIPGDMAKKIEEFGLKWESGELTPLERRRSMIFPPEQQLANLYRRGVSAEGLFKALTELGDKGPTWRRTWIGIDNTIRLRPDERIRALTMLELIVKDARLHYWDLLNGKKEFDPENLASYTSTLSEVDRQWLDSLCFDTKEIFVFLDADLADGEVRDSRPASQANTDANNGRQPELSRRIVQPDKERRNQLDTAIDEAIRRAKGSLKGIPLHTSLLLDLAHVPDAGNEVHYSLHA